MSDWLTLLEGKISADDLARARLEIYRRRSAGDFLLSNKLISPKVLLGALSAHYHLPTIELDHCHPEEEALTKISEEVARRFLMLPLFQLEERLYIALANPEDLSAQDYVTRLTGLILEPVLAVRQSLEAAINRHYVSQEKSAKTLQQITDSKAKTAGESDQQGVHVDDSNAPVIKLISYLLSQGVHLNASDIHLEPFADRCLLRYRVDGVLHEFPPPAFDLFRSLVSRIKILSNLDITERRLPQDGRSRIMVDERPYDLRISIIPNLYGESVVIRILDTTGEAKNLDDLGFAPDLLSHYKKLITRPHGILLVTGPTGSGKTSTLYATLKRIITPEKKFITLEDPVEYQLYGITQFQVNPEIEFTFSKGLRAVLRHDPDIIMLGEIRDLESAEIAVQSSLTGHLVLSTLHTNDAPSAVTRLADMGVPSYLIFTSLIGVLAQRLLRVLCPNCKVESKPSSSQLRAIGLEALPKGARIHGPAGCQTCNNLGYKGRGAIGELLEVNSEMRALSTEKVSAEALRKSAAGQGFTTLKQSALEMLFSGTTSLEEVLSVATGEG